MPVNREFGWRRVEKGDRNTEGNLITENRERRGIKRVTGMKKTGERTKREVCLRVEYTK